MALVEVRATFHDDDRCVAEAAEDERAGVPRGGGGRPAGDVRVADLDRLGDGVREPSETAAEDDPDRGSKLGTARDRSDRGVQGLAQADPSSARESIISTILSTACAGSSVTCSRSRSDGEMSPSPSISPRTQSSISPQ